MDPSVNDNAVAKANDTNNVEMDYGDPESQTPNE